jgi:hypothetical protein
MKKLLLLASVLAAFTVSSALAGSCPSSGGCGGGDKDKEDTTTETEKKS